LSELRSAMRRAGLAEPTRYEGASPEPPRGPAIVGRPLFGFAQGAAASTMAATAVGTGTDIRGLREAMVLAGLSANL
jgi:hypothetical protein